MPPIGVQKPTAEAGAAAIWWSPRRRLTLPARLPSDILTLQSKRHLNLVATTGVGACATQRPFFGEARVHGPIASLIRFRVRGKSRNRLPVALATALAMDAAAGPCPVSPL